MSYYKMKGIEVFLIENQGNRDKINKDSEKNQSKILREAA